MNADQIFARRSQLKMSHDQVATGMAAAGHRWTAATVSMVETGDRDLTDVEAADLAAVLDVAPPVVTTGRATADEGLRVVVEQGPAGLSVAITPEDAPAAEVVYALTLALNTVLHQ